MAAMILLAWAARGAEPVQQQKKTPAKTASKSAPAKKGATRTTTATRRPTSTTSRTSTAARTSSTSRTSTAARRGAGKKPMPRVTWRNRQLAPTPERYKEIQGALVAKGYLKSEDANGTWNQASVDALKKFQSEQNLESTGKINSLSLIALGLGPKHEAPALPKPPDPGQQQPPATGQQPPAAAQQQ